MDWMDRFMNDFESKNNHYDDYYSEYDVAVFVDDNWNEMTGLSNEEKDYEQEFPDVVLELIKDLDLDYDDFCQEWRSVREGTNDYDWEDEDWEDEDWEDEDWEDED